jgi:hypothetical protein
MHNKNDVNKDSGQCNLIDSNVFYIVKRDHYSTTKSPRQYRRLSHSSAPCFSGLVDFSKTSRL